MMACGMKLVVVYVLSMACKVWVVKLVTFDSRLPPCSPSAAAVY